MRSKRKIINLYEDKNISSVKHVVSIDSEDDLNQFWEYITSSQISTHRHLQSFISSFYNFALAYMESEENIFFEIILEENDKTFYFTLWNEKIANTFKNYLKNTSTKFIYKKNKISVKLLKKYEKKNLKKDMKDDAFREKILINSVEKNSKTISYEPFDFIPYDDLEELLNLNDDLQELIYYAYRAEFNDNLFIKLRSTFSLFCFTLRYYDEISKLTVTINNLLNLLNTKKEKFLLLDKLELELFYGFIGNIDRWITTLFVKGGADLHFMDNSIKADYDMIFQIISPNNQDIEFDLDDIFDF